MLISCVEKYSGWAGLSINKEKSGVFVSKGIHSHFCHQIKDQWGFKAIPKDAKYFGLPLFHNDRKVTDFVFVRKKAEFQNLGLEREVFIVDGLCHFH